MHKSPAVSSVLIIRQFAFRLDSFAGKNTFTVPLPAPMYWQSRHQQCRANKAWNLCCSEPLRSGIRLLSPWLSPLLASCASCPAIGFYAVIITPCMSERLEGWVRLRQCLWPDETLDDIVVMRGHY